MIERETIAGFMHVTRFSIGQELGTLGETMFNLFNTPGCDSLVAQVRSISLHIYSYPVPYPLEFQDENSQHLFICAFHLYFQAFFYL